MVLSMLLCTVLLSTYFCYKIAFCVLVSESCFLRVRIQGQFREGFSVEADTLPYQVGLASGQHVRLCAQTTKEMGLLNLSV